jgi:hypothetical protein
MKKNSIWGIISIIWMICGFILLTVIIIGMYSEKYIYHYSLNYWNGIVALMSVGLIISCAGCLVTGIIDSFKKDTKKTLSTISISATASVLFLVLFIVLTPSLFSENVAYGVVTNYGIFDIPSIRIHNDVQKTLYAQRVLKSNTNVIPAVMGERFGFNYVIAGEPDGEEVLIKSVIKYPEPGLITGNKTKLADTSSFYVNLNELRYFGYLFEHDNELIPGLWEIEFFYKGRRLLLQKFQVNKENARTVYNYQIPAERNREAAG